MDIEDEYEENQEIISQLSVMIDDLESKDIVMDLENVIENCKNRVEELEPKMKAKNNEEKRYFNERYKGSVM